MLTLATYAEKTKSNFSIMKILEVIQNETHSMSLMNMRESFYKISSQGYPKMTEYFNAAGKSMENRGWIIYKPFVWQALKKGLTWYINSTSLNIPLTEIRLY